MKRHALTLYLSLLAAGGLAGPLAADQPGPVKPETPTLLAALPNRLTFAAQVQGESTEHQDEATPPRPRRAQEVVQVGSSYHLKKGERARDVVVVFAPVTIDGDVEGDVVVVGGRASINGKVSGSLICPLGSAELGPEAEVQRDVVVVGGELTVAPTAEIGGERREFAFAKFFPHFQWLGDWFREGLFLGRPLPPQFGLFWVVAGVFTLVYLAIALILPKPVNACVQAIETKPIISFFAGLLMLVAFGPLLVVMSITVIGPLVMLAAYLAAGILGRIAVLRFLGEQLGRGLRVNAAQGAVGSLLLGAALVSLLYMVPVLGLAVWLALVPMAIGAATVAAVVSLQSSAAHRPALVPAAVGAMAPTPAIAGAPIPPFVAAPPAFSSAAPGLEPTPVLSAIPSPLGVAVGTAPAEGVASFGIPPTPMPVAANLTPFDHMTLPRAGFWIRLLATFLDFIPMAIVISVAGPAWVLLWTAYHIAMWAWRGSTLGGIVLGLKVVRVDGRPVDLPVALVRGLASYFSLVVVLVGFFWAGWSREKQSWHDMIAGTVIVKVPKSMSLI